MQIYFTPVILSLLSDNNFMVRQNYSMSMIKTQFASGFYLHNYVSEAVEASVVVGMLAV